MARKASTSTKQQKPVLGTCGECRLSYDYHELTAYAPQVPFLCRCPHEQWSQFLDHPCVNGKFQRK